MQVPGTLPDAEDQPVILGNHRDAWVYGAADPNSGTANLLEVAKGLGVLLRSGWRPRRSIVLCSWSGEEYGLLGSTAWLETNMHKPTLTRALAYLNVDVGVSGPHFRAQGTPSLAAVLAGALGAVPDPAMPGHTLAEHWDDGDLYALGSGSDYTAFIDHLGIPSLDLAFSPHDPKGDIIAYGVYHSTFDSFEWMDSVGDPGFVYHVAMARVWGLVTMRLAGTASSVRELTPTGDDATPRATLAHATPLPLPLNFSLQAAAIGGYIADAKARTNGTAHVDYTALDAAHAQFAAAADKAMREHARAMRTTDADADTTDHARAVASLDERLAYTERKFLTPDGLPGRKYFKHALQAPGLYTGYAPKTLPGVYDAVTKADWPTANAQAAVAAAAIAAAAKYLGGDA